MYFGEQIKKLGFGLMRLPKFDDGSFDIEQIKTNFDFYLLHNLGAHRTKFFEDFDLWNFVAEKKREGLLCEGLPEEHRHQRLSLQRCRARKTAGELARQNARQGVGEGVHQVRALRKGLPATHSHQR